jgi:hypothetical protein
MKANVTHEWNEDETLACRAKAGDRAAVPGDSTCGHQNCREIRERLRAKAVLALTPGLDPWMAAWPLPWTNARAYAAGTYSGLRSSICPGGTGHEGNNTSAEYCDACLANAIAAAYEKGKEGTK